MNFVLMLCRKSCRSSCQTSVAHRNASKKVFCNALRETDRQTDRRTDGRTDGRTDRQTERQTDRPTDRQTDRQTHRHFGTAGSPDVGKESKPRHCDECGELKDVKSFSRKRKGAGDREEKSKRCQTCERPACAACGHQATHVIQSNYTRDGRWYCSAACRKNAIAS